MEGLIDDKAKLHLMMKQALREAIAEVLSEQRAEVLKRARAKLVALGVPVRAEDIDATLS